MMSNGMLMPARQIPANVTRQYLEAIHPDLAERRPRWTMEYWAARNYRDDTAKRLALPKNKTEEDDEYSDRIRLSRFCSYARRAVDRMIAAVCEGEPTRGGIEALGDWPASADGSGGSLSTVTAKALDHAAWHGLALALVDSRALDPLESEPRTEADAAGAGLEPYAIVYSPLFIRDLDSDSRGNLTFVKLAYVERSIDNAGQVVERTRYTLITPEKTAVYWVEKSGEVTAGPVIDRNPAFMPAVVLTGPKADAGIYGTCIVGDSLEMDLAAFAAGSDRTFDAHLHAHPHLAVWSLDSLGDIGMGAGRYVKLHPGDEHRKPEQISYVQLDSKGLEALGALEKDARENSQALSGSGAVGQIEGGKATAASGVALAWNFDGQERRTLLALASAAEGFEQKLLRVVAAYKNVTVNPDVVWPRDFSSMRDPAYFAMQLQTIARNGLGGELWRAVAERYAAALVNDAAPARVKKIRAEIAQTDGSEVFGQRVTGPDLGGPEPRAKRPATD